MNEILKLYHTEYDWKNKNPYSPEEFFSIIDEFVKGERKFLWKYLPIIARIIVGHFVLDRNFKS